LPVAVSITPQAWLVTQLGGEHVDVVTVVPPGSSPATYQPSDAEVSRVMSSAIYFRVGVPFENGSWFQAIRSMGSMEIVDVRGDIPLRDIEAHRHNGEPVDEEHHAGDEPHDHVCDHECGKDPHIWLSPPLLKRQAAIIAEALSTAAPEHAGEFDRNLQALYDRLDEVDAEIREKLAPHAGEAFFVFHPAWGYFADEYGLRQIAIEVEGKEPSDSELTEVLELARESGAQVIFVQPQISGESAEAVAKAVGGRVERLDPLAADVAEGLLSAADAIAESLDNAN
jgi:zinc transport system substrate-binding protein